MEQAGFGVAEVDDPAVGAAASSQVDQQAQLRGGKAQGVGAGEEPDLLSAGPLECVAGAAQLGGGVVGLVVKLLWAHHRALQRGAGEAGLEEGVDVGPDEIRQHQAGLEHAVVVAVAPGFRQFPGGVVGVDEGQEAPVAVHDLVGEGQEEAELLLGLPQGHPVGFDHLGQPFAGFLGVEMVVGGHAGAEEGLEVPLEPPADSGVAQRVTAQKGFPAWAAQGGEVAGARVGQSGADLRRIHAQEADAEVLRRPHVDGVAVVDGLGHAADLGAVHPQPYPPHDQARTQLLDGLGHVPSL
ncbi:hypothetical protein Mrose_03502 [Calidithermus roseus]|uniref:Uncharacterized protein n=1 Tax=Calidithermus roseus TaxID=1644118 RepID=A0A399EEF6_9DEIN|nr:hypothetical protein Mrose_03502 [Calidithermus roseus]